MSAASSKRSETSPAAEDTPSPARQQPPPPRRAHASRTSRNVLLFLIAFRVVNALCVKTFFQPDEFFQSLEPAWQIVFGKDSGAWITWVCIPSYVLALADIRGPEDGADGNDARNGANTCDPRYIRTSSRACTTFQT